MNAQKVLFYSVVLKQSNFLHFFHSTKMAANYAKIERVGSLDASFQQVLLIQHF